MWVRQYKLFCYERIKRRFVIKTSHVENILQIEFSSHRLANLNLKCIQHTKNAIFNQSAYAWRYEKKTTANTNKTKLGKCIARPLSLVLRKKCINRLVDANQRPGATVLISVRTYLGRDAAKPTLQRWLRSGGASSRSDQSRCPLNPLVLVYPQCVSSKDSKSRLTRLCQYAVWCESSLCIHVIFLIFKIA